MELILFAMTIMYTIAVALDLFAIELSQTISTATLNAAFGLIITLELLFTYCYLSECLTSDLLDIGDVFYSLPWYRLPAKRQTLLVLPIEQSQQVFRLRNLQLFDCSLTIFTSVNYPEFLSTGQCLLF